MVENNDHNTMVYIAIVAMVAIVALVVVISGNSTTKVLSMDDANQAGLAFASSGKLSTGGNTMYSSGCTAPPASECERCCTGYDSGCVTRCNAGAAANWE